MPLLDIATSKSYFRTNILVPGAPTLSHDRIVFGNENRLTSGWYLFEVPKKEKTIRAVATSEHLKSIQINSVDCGQQPNIDPKGTLEKEHQYSGDAQEEVDGREKLRRMRISKANSGKTPWNKGRKHSTETKQRIKERTWLAMQNPKVKMKLVNLGHAQSEETRVRIGESVRTMWEKKREKLMVQERCHFEWQNLIAEAYKRGFTKEEELQWDSYEILYKELEQEWVESVEQRKQNPRPKVNRRAPKSLEQRRKIAAAISAKWADPAYRDRVCSALSKYHASPARAERQPRRRPSDESKKQPRTPRPTKKKSKLTKPAKIVKGAERQRSGLKRRNVPLYKDPLASSKLEMIKNIRAQRVAAGIKKSQAIEQAMLLIAEAEKAAKALEVAASWSPLARASLSETRNLIAEAIQSVQSIECPESKIQTNIRGINGSLWVEPLESNIKDFGTGEINFGELFNVEIDDPSSRSSLNGLLNFKEELDLSGINGHTFRRSAFETKATQTSFAEKLNHLETNGHSKQERKLVYDDACLKLEKEDTICKPNTVSKRWICGRLVDVSEEEDSVQ